MPTDTADDKDLGGPAITVPTSQLFPTCLSVVLAGVARCRMTVMMLALRHAGGTGKGPFVVGIKRSRRRDKGGFGFWLSGWILAWRSISRRHGRGLEQRTSSSMISSGVSGSSTVSGS